MIAKQQDNVAVDKLEEQLMESCKRQLMEEGKLVLTDTGYQLTELGMKAVKKELRRYEFRPAMALMVEIFILTQHEYSVW